MSDHLLDALIQVGKDVDSMREIRDVAPDTFREEVMNDLVRNQPDSSRFHRPLSPGGVDQQW